MKWQGRAGSGNIEDRRGMGGMALPVGGGIGGRPPEPDEPPVEEAPSPPSPPAACPPPEPPESSPHPETAKDADTASATHSEAVKCAGLIALPFRLTPSKGRATLLGWMLVRRFLILAPR